MKALTVTGFLEFVNAAFSEAVFPDGAVVEGEVAEYRVSQGKWIWFLLKDEESVCPCFATTWQLRMPLEDGMTVRVFGRPKIHAKSGKFSLNVERAEPVGEGALRRAYDLLKKRLQEEGIFAPERKRAIPQFPNSIGLIASRESAAYTDFLRILGARWGGVEVNSAHVQVQGRDAVQSIVRAFEYFNSHPELADVLVLTRGGGSLEDLQAFNSEEVTRAVFSSRIPVVVGVGHERDESLADYAADVRASTPTDAARLVVPDRTEVAAALATAERRLDEGMGAALERRRATVEHAVRVMDGKFAAVASEFGHRFRDLSEAFRRFAESVARSREECARLSGRVDGVASLWLKRMGESLTAKERMLASLNPRDVLRRGYAVVRKGGRAIKDAAELSISDRLEIELHRGHVAAEVAEVKS